jgi:hypothetical protein
LTGVRHCFENSWSYENSLGIDTSLLRLLFFYNLIKIWHCDAIGRHPRLKIGVLVGSRPTGATYGLMAEWLIATVLKTVVPARGPGVQIPLNPLDGGII